VPETTPKPSEEVVKSNTPKQLEEPETFKEVWEEAKRSGTSRWGKFMWFVFWPIVALFIFVYFFLPDNSCEDIVDDVIKISKLSKWDVPYILDIDGITTNTPSSWNDGFYCEGTAFMSDGGQGRIHFYKKDGIINYNDFTTKK